MSMYCLFFIFFFQAEDGIRDIGVTGVQTCALPIYRGGAAPGAAHALGPALLAHGGEALALVQQTRKVDQVGSGHDGGGSSRERVGYRSEERRVGKECRSRGSPYH